MSKATKFRKIRDGMTAAVAALGATSLIAGLVVLGTAGAAQANGQGNGQGNGGSEQPQTSSNQVWVCKYTGGPQQGFTLRDANQPQKVGANSIQEGGSFADANPTIKIADGDADPAPTVADCPQPPDPEPTQATAVAPSVTQSSACDVQGSYTIPSTAGVRYLLGGQPIAAGTYSGPANGTITAEALEGYELTNESFSFALNVAAAEKCDDEPTPATAVAPSVTQSSKCEVEGSYTIPSTAGVRYLLDGQPIAAGTYSGPANGTITAEALEGYELTNESFSFTLAVDDAEECDDTTPPTDPPTTPPVVPSPPPVSPPVVTPPVVTPPTTDVCSNIPGTQESVPVGYTAVDGICTEDDVAGEETEPPEPTKTDKPKGQQPVSGPDEVLGDEAVPTAVAAGIGGPTGPMSSSSSLLGQGLVAGGLMMLLLAGSAQMGRRQRGAHER